MEQTALTLNETKDMFIFMSEKMIASKDLLTQADKAIGDGDHGIGMAKGFEAVREKLRGAEFATLAELLKTVGFALMTSIGGASGAIFGTLYQGAAAKTGDCKVFDSKALSHLLGDGLDAVKRRGKSKPGDKTMVDALEPAAQAASTQVAAPLESALEAATEAARDGMEKTKAMVATMGRAKSLGDRAIGHPDPGAVSTHLILSYMAQFVKENGTAMPKS